MQPPNVFSCQEAQVADRGALGVGTSLGVFGDPRRWVPGNAVIDLRGGHTFCGCRQGASLEVVTLQPSAVRPASSLALLRRPTLVIRPSRSPLFSAVLRCKVTQFGPCNLLPPASSVPCGNSGSPYFVCEPTCPACVERVEG